MRRTIKSKTIISHHVAISQIWKSEANNRVMTGYNLFLSTNLAAFNQEYQIDDYRLIHISVGQLALPSHLSVEDYGEGRIYLQWQNGLPADSKHNQDYLWAMWLKSDGSFPLHSISTADITRQKEQAVLEVKEAGEESIHLYIYFSDISDLSFSPDRYFYLPTKNSPTIDDD